MKALVIYGPSASGKSTLASSVWEEPSVWGINMYYTRNIERDVIRKETIPGFRDTGWEGYNFDSGMERVVSFYWDRELHNAFESGRDVVISDTLCKVGDRRKLNSLLWYLGYDVQYTRMPTSLEECIERDSKRGIWEVGEDVIRRQWDNLNKHSGHI